jgi:hypothetical protein
VGAIVLSGKEFQVVSLQERDRHRLDLHLPKTHPDTESLTPPKGNIGTGLEFFLLFRGEAIGIKGFGIGEDMGKMMGKPGAVSDIRSPGNPLTIDLKIFNRPAGTDPGGRIHPQGFCENLVEIGKPAYELLRCGRAIPEYRINLFVKPAVDRPIHPEEHEHPGKGAGGGIVPRKEKGHRLVANLLVGESFSFLLGADEKIEDIFPEIPFLAPASDLREKEIVHISSSLL